MCGIAGFYGFNDLSSEQIAFISKEMGNEIEHRGPDRYGYWADESAEVALIHQRLSILDLSHAGNQPMHSPSGRFIISYNGEVYNHLEIRRQLETQLGVISWNGSSDTETISCAIEHWGIKRAAKEFDGMFAIAIWDKKLKYLTLLRDRAGQKPLYYGWQNNVFMFASELKALKKHPSFVGNIDRDSVQMQMSGGCIPAPHSIYRGVFKLLPGSVTTIDLSGIPSKQPPAIESYWLLSDSVQAGKGNQFQGTLNDAVDELDIHLTRSIKSQMISDVPIGAFLSGGIDSSLVVSIMQSQSIQPVNTFTIGFEEAKFNEANFAKEIAKFLGTNHTEHYVSSAEALDVIPHLPTLYDEPFSDSSQIPTYLVSKLARGSVTVSLSGDGGDELFGGYNRHIYSQRWGSMIQHLPPFSKNIVQKLLLSLNPNNYNFLETIFSKPYMPNIGVNNLSNHIDKITRALNTSSNQELYESFTTHWPYDQKLVLGASKFKSNFIKCDECSLSEEMMFNDFMFYLSNDILAKVDRAAMGLGLETRVPMLDESLIEYAWTLPEHMKINNGQGKVILKKLLDKYIPNKLYNRPKQGFALPIEGWLRGPLLDWTESLISKSRLDQEGYFNSEMVLKKWAEHKSGKRNWQTDLWNVLMFQAWLERQ